MKKVLIVWSEVPEKIAIFVSLSLDKKTADKLCRFNDQYINSCHTSDELSAEMNEFFYGKDFGHFKYEKDEVKGPIVGEDYDLIIQCGFIL